MSLAHAEQSIQLLTCHISRWRLCHCLPQDNQSKSWKKVWPLFVCHWSLFMPLAPAGQSIQLFICHISRWRLCHCSPQDNQSKSWEKVCPLDFLSLGKVSMTPGNILLLVYIRLGISSKAYKIIKIVPVCKAINSSRKFFSIQIFDVIPPNWKGLLSLVASIGTSRAEHTTFYMSFQQIETLSSFTARQPIQILGKGVTSGVVVTGDGV